MRLTSSFLTLAFLSLCSAFIGQATSSFNLPTKRILQLRSPIVIKSAEENNEPKAAAVPAGGAVSRGTSFSVKQSLYTFAGAFVNFSILTQMNRYFTKTHGAGASIVLGPFGALMTLIYGLSAAPAAQPRSALLGQALSVSLAILLRGIPLSSWWTLETRISFTAAAVIGLMVKTGLTHPPAGAATVLFASNDALGWSHLSMLLLANAVTVIVANITIKLAKRKYPTDWSIL